MHALSMNHLLCSGTAYRCSESVEVGPQRQPSLIADPKAVTLAFLPIQGARDSRIFANQAEARHRDYMLTTPSPTARKPRSHDHRR